MSDILNITIRKGVPLPGKVSKNDERPLSEIIAGIKKGESFLVSPDLRTRVLNTANYLRRTNKINFKLVSRSIIEGGYPVAGVWRVEAGE